LLAVYEERADRLAEAAQEEPPPPLPPPPAVETAPKATAIEIQRSADAGVKAGFVAVACAFRAWLAVAWPHAMGCLAKVSPRAKTLATSILPVIRAAYSELHDVLRYSLARGQRQPLAWLGVCALWGAVCSMVTLLLSR
jgi:hypothetical protein